MIPHTDNLVGEKAIAEITANDIVETVPSALIILDRNLNINSANRAFYQTFRTSREETEGSLIYDLGNRQWDIPALRTLLESVIPHRASVEGFEVEHDFPTIGRRTIAASSSAINVCRTCRSGSRTMPKTGKFAARPGRPRRSANRTNGT